MSPVRIVSIILIVYLSAVVFVAGYIHFDSSVTGPWPTIGLWLTAPTSLYFFFKELPHLFQPQQNIFQNTETFILVSGLINSTPVFIMWLFIYAGRLITKHGVR
jgi:hypothetical protein